ncbi:MAG: thioredoxin family protein [Pseudomonadota bacterium]
MSNQSLVIATALLSALFATSLGIASDNTAQPESETEPVDNGHFAAVESDDAPSDLSRPYDETRNAIADVEAALSRARTRGVNTIIIMGANWCHDSRGLATHLSSDRFSPMIRQNYELVYVDIGSPQTGGARNLEIPARYGVEDISGTPNVLIISPNGTLLNTAKDVKSWRNADSRDADDVYAYFESYRADQK